MGASENRLKSQRMAADLVKRGIFHGKRTSHPYPNSGGTTMGKGPGSSKYQRYLDTQQRNRQPRHENHDES